jgi:negative regulator of flagellin synthesis FlgM
VKINSAISPVGSGLDAGRAKPAGQPAPHSTSSSGDKVAISALAVHLQETSAAQGETSAVDFARVTQIKQAISEGRFKINPERIADGLLESVRQMLARQR